MLSSILAQAADTAQGGAPILGNPIFMIVIFIVIFWVLMIRPQRKAQKEHAERVNSLKKGDQVITNAGIHGTIEYVGDTTVSLKISDTSTIKIEKNAVVQIIRS